MLFARNAGLLTLAAVAFAGSMIAVKTVASAAEAGAIPPVMSCEALANIDLSPLDARISTAGKTTRNGHAFCDVKGYISPLTQFEALLPTETWRGDYLQQGCGGFCGKVEVNLDDPSRTSGYQAPYAPLSDGEMVVAADDQGHETASNGDALWGRNDLRLRAVFGYSSEHQLARTMQAMMRAFYGRKAAYSYFSGVSDGGHEALVLAQLSNRLRRHHRGRPRQQLGASPWLIPTLGRRSQPKRARWTDSDRGEAPGSARRRHGRMRRRERRDQGPSRLRL
jgi:Tannase and feruloyl esterase